MVNVVVDWLFNLYEVVDFDNFVDGLHHFNDLRYFNSFHNNLGDDFWNSHYFFLIEWNFDSSVHNFLNFFDNGEGHIDDLLNFFNAIYIDNFFFDHLNFLNCWLLDLDLDYLFNNFWNLNNFFYCLNDGDYLFDDDLYNLREFNDMVNNFSCISVLDNFNSLFNDSIEWLDNFNNFLYNLLFDNFHLNNFPNDLFNGHDLLLDYLNYSYFRDSVVNDFLYSKWLLHLNYSLNYNFYLHYLGDFNNSFDNSFDDSWNLYDFLIVMCYFDYFFNDVVDVFDDFNRDMDYLFDFLDLDDLN